MNELQVLDLIIQQIGDLRIPMRETELFERLSVIAGNVQALRDAVEKSMPKKEDETAAAKDPDEREETADAGKPDEREGGGEDVLC